jgi:hypothetical protein
LQTSGSNPEKSPRSFCGRLRNPDAPRR